MSAAARTATHSPSRVPQLHHPPQLDPLPAQYESYSSKSVSLQPEPRPKVRTAFHSSNRVPQLYHPPQLEPCPPTYHRHGRNQGRLSGLASAPSNTAQIRPPAADSAVRLGQLAGGARKSAPLMLGQTARRPATTGTGGSAASRRSWERRQASPGVQPTLHNWPTADSNGPAGRYAISVYCAQLCTYINGSATKAARQCNSFFLTQWYAHAAKEEMRS